MQPLYFFFAARRARRLHAQVTHVAVPLVLHEPGSASFQQRTDLLHIFEYATLWTLAKKLLNGGAEHLTLQLFEHTPKDDSTLCIKGTGDSYEVWPVMFQPPRKERQATALDRLDQAPRKRRPPTGGVKVLPPDAEIVQPEQQIAAAAADPQAIPDVEQVPALFVELDSDIEEASDSEPSEASYPEEDVGRQESSMQCSTCAEAAKCNL